MLKSLWGWIKGLFQIEEVAEKPLDHLEKVPQYNVPEVWPFPGDKPTNIAVHRLVTGMETTKDHIVYRDVPGGQTRGSVRGSGNRTWPAKMMVWWVSEKEWDQSRKLNSISQNCSYPRCVNPDHLTPVYQQQKQEKPTQGSADPLPVEYSGGPAVYQPKKKKRQKIRTEYNDRTKCVSAKIWFPSEEVAQETAAYYNKNLRKPGTVRIYGYQCDWCGGGHHTKSDPKKRKTHKHVGSW